MGGIRVKRRHLPASAGNALDALSRVPWDGGPSYYSQFAAMQGTEWESDAFFPIMYWGAYIDDPAKADNNAAHGINCYGELYAPATTASAAMRSAGIWNLGWASTEQTGTPGTEYVGSMYFDEADMKLGISGTQGTWNGWSDPHGCSPGGTVCAIDCFQQLHTSYAAVAGDGRLRYFPGGKSMWMKEPLDPGYQYLEGNPTDGWPIHLVTAAMYYYTDGGLHGGDPAFDGEVTTYFGIPRDQCRRAGNYGYWTRQRYEDMQALSGQPRKPWSPLVELGQQTTTTNTEAMEYAVIDADQIEGAVMSGIVHEARFVSYFSHAFGNQPTSDALNHPAGNAHYDSVKAKLTTLHGRIQALAPVLNTQSYEHTFNASLDTMLKGKDGYAYIFAMQKVSATTSGTYTLTLPAGMPASGTVEVLHESRTIPHSGGTFEDSFAQEYTHHIYKVAL